jgi:nitrate reductase delta subunit
MALTYRALALLLTYPSVELKALAPAALAAIHDEGLVPEPLVRSLGRLVDHIMATDLYDLQEGYVQLFDRTRSLSLNLYEHVHGESRDRGPAMVALLELYRSKGLELSASELPDHLPVFLEFLSTLPEDEASSLLGDAAHVLEAMSERLKSRDSRFRAVFGALAALAGEAADQAVLAALLLEPDDDPDDLEALDKAWAETAVTFGPAEVGCPKAESMLAAMDTDPAPPRRRAPAAEGPNP